MEAASRFNADLAFFSCRGIHPESGITDSTEEEADIKRTYIRQSHHAFLLCDSSKIGKQYFSKVGGLNAVHKILTNVPLGDEYQIGQEAGRL
ncbi:MAG: DeoR/GlpR transcriptional regulator, partial [Clostridia bacterium]|nr:DeoR/GlpR transcriptional regulator [Clostridia bacterium]